MPQAPPNRAARIRFGGFELDTRAGELHKGDQCIRLQEQCFQILTMLLARPGEVVTREELRARLWPHGTVVDFEHSVNAAIKRLREALGDSADNPQFVETIPRRGYRFLAKVESDETTARPEKAPSTQLSGRYELLEKVGAGGMGEVYRARDTRLQREVAIKLLPPGMVTDEIARRRFRQEALSLSRISHPNIATLFDFDTDGATDFLVMEYVSGATLTQKLASGPLPLEEVRELGTQLCDGLAAAHAQDIIHRDLKPDNLKITTDGRLKILDFGLAKLMTRQDSGAETVSATESTAFAGTPLYMAPEQIRGQPLDARTDVWALGAVLYEMATGKLPFHGASSGDVCDAILHSTPPAPVRLNPDVPAELEQIIGKALEKDPEVRYQGAAEMKADLVRLKRHASATDIVTPRAQRGWLAAHWKLAAGAVAALAIIVTIAIFFYTRPSVHALTEKDEILLADFVNTTGEPIFDGTLKTAVAVKLGESPYLNTVSDTRVHDTLKLMQKPEGEKLVGAVAREACQRLNVKALLNSSIAHLGNDYVITLEALNCQTGEVLAREQAEARGQGEVLNVVGQASSKLRPQLGESIKSVQRFDTPLEQATTSSLEALQAFSLGWQQIHRGGEPGSSASVSTCCRTRSQFCSGL